MIARARSSRGAALAAVLACALAGLAGAGPAAAQDAGDPPRVQARSAILVEPTSGEVVYERRAQERRAVASTVKLMTALVTLEEVEHLENMFTAVPYDASPAESRINLRPGERMTVRDLLTALLLESANDAAATLAVGVSGSRDRFVAAMNRRAAALGLDDTQYRNAVGLDAPGARSSAADLVRLTRELRKHPFFVDTVDLPRATLRTGDRRRRITNRNTLVRTVDWIDGVKTGRTAEAGYVLVGSGTRRDVTLISAVLGEPSEAARERDTLALLRWGQRQFKLSHPVDQRDTLASARISHFGDDEVPLVPGRDFRRVIRRDERIGVSVDAPSEVEGPLQQGAPVGTITLRHRGRVIGRVPLVTSEAVPEADLAQRLSDYFSRGSTLALILALGLCSVSLGLLRRRAHQRSGRRRREGRDRGTEAA